MPEIHLTRVDWFIAAPLLWLAGAAVLLLLADAIQPSRRNNLFIALIGLVGAGIGLLPLLAELSRTQADLVGFSDMMRITEGGLILAMLCLGSAVACGFLAWNNLDRYEQGRHSTAFWTLLLIAPTGMLLTLWADHMVMLFLGIETLSLPLYAMAALRRREDASIEAGLKYFLLGAFASGFLAFGMASLYAGTGSMTTEAVGLAVSGGPQAIIGLGMILIGLFFKAGAAPYHLWVADVYQGSPTPVTALMAAGTKAAAFGALIRWMPGAEIADEHAWIVLGLLTLLLANFAALNQTNLKRMLALSGVAHAGILFLAMGAQIAQGGAPHWGTVNFYLVAYGLAALAGFGALEVLERRVGGISDGERLRGLGRRHPLLGAAPLYLHAQPGRRAVDRRLSGQVLRLRGTGAGRTLGLGHGGHPPDHSGLLLLPAGAGKPVHGRTGGGDGGCTASQGGLPCYSGRGGSCRPVPDLRSLAWSSARLLTRGDKDRRARSSGK